MGHRAHYALRRDGRTRLFYSHWGARTVPEDLFFGPRHAYGFLDRLESARVWLDDVWAEGGAAIDHESKVLAFFGGDTDEDLIEAWLQLMRASWAGWSIRWVDGMPDLASVLGVDPASVKGDAWAQPEPPAPLPPQTPLEEAAPRIWDALSKVETRKDVLYANARQTLGGLPPEPVYGENVEGHPQFLVRVPRSWPGPMAAEAAFTFVQTVARSEPAEALGARAFGAAIDAEEAGLALDVLASWGALGTRIDTEDTAPGIARGLAWLLSREADVHAALADHPVWQPWVKVLPDAGAPSAAELLDRRRALV
ncbi:MAG: hypothetical protein AAF602_31485 [Myxococcota bacterium]